MKRVAILIEKFFDEKELIYPYIRLLEEGYEVHLVGTEKNAVYPGKSTFTEKSTHAASEVKADDYDGVVIPGGYSPDHMRRNPHMIEFVKEMDRQGKPIAAICHGPWMMASCCNLKGKKLTGFFAIKDDIVNAGAEYVDAEVVVDGNLITSRTPKDLPAFMKAFIEKVGK
ncbi:MAG: type 1 glutamine amidotransferase domain-containing protein [Tepidanaerobacteraceae bacterium]|jgi:protease I|nr:type 1 glutamine amidotransferase [Tepidanaerobacter sp.]HQA61037.1 type 1 glutamine amidotransferase domain-containing protein [Tepidanaerobacteraceae bacterium]HQE06099.1 type 1 glutamine amidotransferase domain-containing protein [Tepidanaerobacteraceae bacterium]